MEIILDMFAKCGMLLHCDMLPHSKMDQIHNQSQSFTVILECS